MRKTIRPFMVETKSRHRSVATKMASLIRRTEATATTMVAAPRAAEAQVIQSDVGVLERPAPRRVLPAIEPPKPDLEPRMVRHHERSIQSDAVEADEAGLAHADPSERAQGDRVSDPEEHEIRVKRGRPPGPGKRLKPERAIREVALEAAAPVQAIEAAVLNVQIRRDYTGKIALRPGMEWAARLPEAVQRRLAHRRPR